MGLWDHVPIVNTIKNVKDGNYLGALATSTVDPFGLTSGVDKAAQDYLSGKTGIGDAVNGPTNEQKAGYDQAIAQLQALGTQNARAYQQSGQRQQAYYSPAIDFYNTVYGPGSNRYGRAAGSAGGMGGISGPGMPGPAYSPSMPQSGIDVPLGLPQTAGRPAIVPDSEQPLWAAARARAAAGQYDPTTSVQPVRTLKR